MDGVELIHLPAPPAPLPGEQLLTARLNRAPRQARLPGERQLRASLRLPDPNDPGWLAEAHGADVAFPVLAPPRGSWRHKSIAWLPDFQHVNAPHFFSPSDIARRNHQFYQLAQACQRIVVSSETVADDFKRCFPESLDKLRVVRFPSWNEFEPFASSIHLSKEVLTERYDIRGPLILCVNQFWRHKNHAMIIEAMKHVVDRNPTARLVMTGLPVDARDADNSYLSELLQLVHRLKLAQHVLLLGLVPKDELNGLFLAADLLLQPSLSEGWNTSVEDAKSLGLQIAAIESKVLREQCPQAVFFSNSPGSASSAILHALEDRRNSETHQVMAKESALQFGKQILDIMREATDCA